jgi:hypothetical protein
MAVRFLDLKAQYESVRSDIDRAIADVIRDSAFVSGEYVTRFEQEFAKYQGAIHCIGCGNGTDAIEIALEALELPQNAEVTPLLRAVKPSPDPAYESYSATAIPTTTQFRCRVFGAR